MFSVIQEPVCSGRKFLTNLHGSECWTTQMLYRCGWKEWIWLERGLIAILRKGKSSAPCTSLHELFSWISILKLIASVPSNSHLLS